MAPPRNRRELHHLPTDEDVENAIAWVRGLSQADAESEHARCDSYIERFESDIAERAKTQTPNEAVNEFYRWSRAVRPRGAERTHTSTPEIMALQWERWLAYKLKQRLFQIQIGG